MRLISYRRNGKDSYGIVTDAGVIDLGSQLGSKYPDLKALIAGDALAEAQAIARQARASADLQTLSLLPVIPNPAKILCIGLILLDVYATRGGRRDRNRDAGRCRRSP